MNFNLKYEDLDTVMTYLNKACCCFCDNNNCGYSNCYYADKKNSPGKTVITGIKKCLYEQGQLFNDKYVDMFNDINDRVNTNKNILEHYSICDIQ